MTSVLGRHSALFFAVFNVTLSMPTPWEAWQLVHYWHGRFTTVGLRLLIYMTITQPHVRKTIREAAVTIVLLGLRATSHYKYTLLFIGIRSFESLRTLVIRQPRNKGTAISIRD